MKLETKLALAVRNNTIEKVYDELVVEGIRKNYSLNAELAILRQRDTKPEEFAIYNEYVEAIKSLLKKQIAEIKAKLNKD